MRSQPRQGQMIAKCSSKLTLLPALIRYDAEAHWTSKLTLELVGPILVDYQLVGWQHPAINKT